jgi:hypothetical protein
MNFVFEVHGMKLLLPVSKNVFIKQIIVNIDSFSRNTITDLIDTND